MKRVLVLGAQGHLGKEIVKQLEKEKTIEQTCYDRELITYLPANGHNIQADVCDPVALYKVTLHQDYIVCSLNGDWLKQAQTLVEVLKDNTHVTLIWITGMGIHDEVKGRFAHVWRGYVRMYPEYIQAANCIMHSGIHYTLLRTADLVETTSHIPYCLHFDGEEARSQYVSISNVAQFIVKMIIDENQTYVNKSIGITNAE